jgi:SnoaL-like domain
MTTWRNGVLLFLFGVCLVPVIGHAQRAVEDRSLAVRVQRLEDLEEIRILLLDYGRFLDTRDFGAYSRLFARDGAWIGGFGSVQGPAAIHAFMEKNMGTAPNRASRHLAHRKLDTAFQEAVERRAEARQRRDVSGRIVQIELGRLFGLWIAEVDLRPQRGAVFRPDRVVIGKRRREMAHDGPVGSQS